jgi:hypothetical protein
MGFFRLRIGRIFFSFSVAEWPQASRAASTIRTIAAPLGGPPRTPVASH